MIQGVVNRPGWASGNSLAIGFRRRLKEYGRQRLPKSLRRQRVVFDLAEHEKQCPHCRSELKRIGEEISKRLEYMPASMLVIEEARQKYACGNGCTIVTAEKPISPIEKGLPGPGLLARAVISKYGDHLPLALSAACLVPPLYQSIGARTKSAQDAQQFPSLVQIPVPARILCRAPGIS